VAIASTMATASKPRKLRLITAGSACAKPWSIITRTASGSDSVASEDSARKASQPKKQAAMGGKVGQQQAQCSEAAGRFFGTGSVWLGFSHDSSVGAPPCNGGGRGRFNASN